MRFDRALERLRADGFGIFVEASPHPVLQIALAQGTEADGAAVVAGSLRRGRGGTAQPCGRWRSCTPRASRSRGGACSRPRTRAGRTFPRTRSNTAATGWTNTTTRSRPPAAPRGTRT
ncbi:hypothetical protein ACFQ60_00465 [Streptomyces zhihengii]